MLRQRHVRAAFSLAFSAIGVTGAPVGWWAGMPRARRAGVSGSESVVAVVLLKPFSPARRRRVSEATGVAARRCVNTYEPR